MDAADLSPVPESQQTQPAFDLFLIFAAANIVATTLQTGAVLGARYGRTDVVVLVVAGACFGASLVAMLAPVGSRTGVPSMIAARAPLGYRGAQVVSGLLYLTNFAWIAVNNTIAASVCAQVLGGSDTRARLVRGPRRAGHRGGRARTAGGWLRGSDRHADHGRRRRLPDIGRVHAAATQSHPALVAPAATRRCCGGWTS